MIKVPLHATLRSGAQIDPPQKGVVSKKQTNPRPLRRIGPVANTDTKLLIYGLFQKSRVLAQDEIEDTVPSPDPPPQIIGREARTGERDGWISRAPQPGSGGNRCGAIRLCLTLAGRGLRFSGTGRISTEPFEPVL